MKYLSRILPAFLFICLLKPLQAQKPDIVFNHLTEKDGLSYNIVNCFLKDSKGMLWIGTYNGLNRYDGAHFYILRSGPDSNSLHNNTVHKLAEDKESNIWGATDDGIFCYRRSSADFKNYTIPNQQVYTGSLNIVCDSDDEIWASNYSGLIHFDKRTDSFVKAPVKNDSSENYKEIGIRKNGIVESPDGKGLWIAAKEGLLYYNKKTQHYTSALNSTDTLLFSPSRIAALCKTKFGHIWYFDNIQKKLVGFDPIQQKVLYTLTVEGLSNISYGATLFEDNDHILWFSSWNYEVYTIDYLHSNKATRIKHNDNNVSTIAGDFFWDAMQDEMGTLWLGTVGGISRCNPNRSFYKVHHLPESFFPAINPAIDFVAENKVDKSWWVSTNKGVLIRYNSADTSTIAFELSKFILNKNKNYPGRPNKMIFLKQRALLFTDNGAWEKKSDASFKPLELPAPANNMVLRDALQLNDSVLYCSSQFNVIKWNILSNKIDTVIYKQSFNTNGNPQLAAYLTEGKNNTGWMISAYNWISNIKDTDLIPIKFSSIENTNVNGAYTAMVTDPKGALWITKKGDGLFNYDPATGQSKQYKQYDGLVMDHVMNLAADQSGKIWSIAYNQVSVLNPILISFYNFTLPLSTSNYLYANYMTSLSNGNILCNVADNLVEFFPGKLKPLPANEKPLISMLIVNGDEVMADFTKEIALQPGENNLQIKFGTLTDNTASPYDMLYILEGAEKNWSTTSSTFEASYNSLPSGNYTFKVKALAKDKSWQTKETVLHINIATPFYKSWWFISLIVAAAGLGVYAFYRYRLYQHRQVLFLEGKAQMLEKEKTHVLYESLKQQLNPHFLFNSLTSLSGLIATDQEMAATFLDQMSKTYRYILKSSDNETVPLKDEIAFVKLYIKLQRTRFKNGLIVNIDIPEEYYHNKIAPVTLQNLIENAIKHNVIDVNEPLVIDMFVEDEYLVVKNNLQKKNVVETSNKKGLENLSSLYRYLSDHPIVIRESDKEYIIKIPLL